MAKLTDGKPNTVFYAFERLEQAGLIQKMGKQRSLTPYGQQVAQNCYGHDELNARQVAQRSLDGLDVMLFDPRLDEIVVGGQHEEGVTPNLFPYGHRSAVDSPPTLYAPL